LRTEPRRLVLGLVVVEIIAFVGAEFLPWAVQFELFLAVQAFFMEWGYRHCGGLLWVGGYMGSLPPGASLVHAFVLHPEVNLGWC
jgi:hypothetical protein